MSETIYSNLADAVNSAVTRRKFMQLTGIGAGSILGGSMLAKLQAVAAPPIGATDGVLVLVYLGGGCDLLNTVVPYTSNTYKSLRPNLYLSPDAIENRNKCIPIDDQYALHSSLKNLSNLYSQGKVTLIPGVGFEGQDLSHFTSSESYMGGWLGDGKAPTGWAGRFLDTFDDAHEENTRGITVNAAMPLALQGAISSPISLPTDITRAYNPLTRQTHKIEQTCIANLRNLNDTSDSLRSEVIAGIHGALDLPADYQDAYVNIPSDISSIERNLAIAAGTINANLGARVIHISLGGFDNHVNQLDDHAGALAVLDNAIGVFFDLLSPVFADRVTMMTYSEFGRRAQENGTGTDHGRAALMTLIGNNVNPGLATDFPSMTDLDRSGNLPNTVDFRKIYAEVSSTWLKTDESVIVGKQYDSIGLFKQGPGGSSVSNPEPRPTTTTKPTTTTAPSPTTTTPAPSTTMPSPTTRPAPTTTMPSPTTTMPKPTPTTAPKPTPTTTIPLPKNPLPKPKPKAPTPVEKQLIKLVKKLIRRWLRSF